MKKILTMFSCLFLICAMWSFNINSPLKDYEKDEVYINYNSSNATILNNDSFFYLIRTGESCVIEKENFDMQTFLNKFNADIVATENIDGGVNYYGYSKTIKNYKIINEKKINLQAFVGNKVVVGSPIIYGSY